MDGREATEPVLHDALRRRYLHGECMVLAATLAERPGYALVAIHDRTWTNVPRHVGVVGPDGLYGDARGLSLDRAAFLSGYDGDATEIRPIGLSDLHRIWGARVVCWRVGDNEIAALDLDHRSLAA